MHNKIAYVFPGQGSQTVRMLDAWGADATVRSAVAEASEVLGFDLWLLIEAGPAETLDLSINTQPALVAASVAMYRVWHRRVRSSPVKSAGHSVGEYSALVASGALTLSDAIRVVQFRSRAMVGSAAAGGGGMAAVIGLRDDAVEKLCADCAEGDILQPAHYDAPGVVVVAGHRSAIERIKSRAKEAGAKMVFVLPVAGPFHSPLMQAAAEELGSYLRDLVVGRPAFDVLHNSDLRTADRYSIKEALVAQLTQPIRWVDTIRRFQQAGVTHVIELGPGEALTNIAKRIAPTLHCFSVNSPATLESAVRAVMETRR